MNYQGGKAFGQKKQDQEKSLSEINEKYITDGTFKDVDDLEDKLEAYKKQFMDADLDASGDIDLMELKKMLEKMGQAKTHLELKKMIAEVDTNNSGTIHYHEFIQMMLGSKNSILRIILKYEEMNKPKEGPKGPPPKRSLADLP